MYWFVFWSFYKIQIYNYEHTKTFSIYIIVCYQNGVIYPQNDLDDSPYNLGELSKDAQLAECHELCQNTSGCDYFSFQSTTSLCSLKSAKSREHPQQSYISGNKYCGNLFDLKSQIYLKSFSFSWRPEYLTIIIIILT